MFPMLKLQDVACPRGVRWSDAAEREPEVHQGSLFPLVPHLPRAAAAETMTEAPGPRSRPAVVALVGTTPRARSLVYPLRDALVKASQRPFVLTDSRETYSGRRTRGQGMFAVEIPGHARGALLHER